LARAFALAGDRSGATTQYETSLELWRDADDEIPWCVRPEQSPERYNPSDASTCSELRQRG